eukprot:NODE_1176_length_1660_cov_27.886406_g1043_i0.p1 GENE.NODE_1176_length_1660_cov_27.886406_g1043_i0~~NODE_1176_length_1660_cov_27.886406_g1043_i0.p1  ORF type:complete len:283 (+),score=32.91 NODE_1176_length_1660_cov_27.886406_g1043_i0:70-849(+)
MKARTRKAPTVPRAPRFATEQRANNNNYHPPTPAAKSAAVSKRNVSPPRRSASPAPSRNAATRSARRGEPTKPLPGARNQNSPVSTDTLLSMSVRDALPLLASIVEVVDRMRSERSPTAHPGAASRSSSAPPPSEARESTISGDGRYSTVVYHRRGSADVALTNAFDNRPVNGLQEGWTQDQLEAYSNAEVEREECEICHRRFARGRLEVHAAICRRSAERRAQQIASKDRVRKGQSFSGSSASLFSQDLIAPPVLRQV